jgi:MFS family permease
LPKRQSSWRDGAKVAGVLMLRNDRFYGWTLLAACWACMFLNLGFPAYGPSVINAAMARALHLPRETLGDMFSVYMIMSGLPGPLVALSVNRFGARRTLMLGSAFNVVGSVLMATVVTGGIGAMICFGLLVGSGVATGAALAGQAVLARWFVRRRSLVLSILYSSGALGGFVSAPSMNALIQATGNWRSGWWLLAGLSTLAGVIAAVFVRERPEDVGQLVDGAAAPVAGAAAVVDTRPRFVTRYEWGYAEALRSPAYWVLLVALLGVSGGVTLFLAHGVVHLQDLGHSAAVGAWAVGTMTVTGLLGKLILATLGDRLDPRYIYASFILAFAVGMWVIVDARATWQVFLFATCLGIGFGGGVVCYMSVLSNYYGTRAFASLAGLAIAINTTLSAIAPKVAGHLYDRGIGYATTFYFLAAWCVIGALVVIFLQPPHPGPVDGLAHRRLAPGA